MAVTNKTISSFRGLKAVCQKRSIEMIESLSLKAEDVKYTPWRPDSDPQWCAAKTEAFETLFGGQAGGGKSALALILATIAHRNSIILRRVYPNLKEIHAKALEILQGSGARYNGTEKLWKGIPGGRTLEYGTVQHEKDMQAYRGRPHDLKVFDELTEFSELTYQFIIGWTRSHVAGQRCRVLATCNPPDTKEGRWVVKRWAPWLDSRYTELKDIDGNHPVRAKSGEIRWFIRASIPDANLTEEAILQQCPPGSFLIRVIINSVVREVEIEVPTSEPFKFFNRKRVPTSRTFIKSTLDDNRWLRDSSYRDVLDAMPEPYRSQLLEGDFSIGEVDDAYQVIPSAWVRRAQSLWKARPEYVPPISAVGVDVARGGADNTVIAIAHDWWVAPMIVFPGKATPDGWETAKQVEDAIAENTSVNIRIDAEGIGASPFDILNKKDYNVQPMVSSAASVDADGKIVKDITGTLCFKNKRAEWWWRLRDLLNPVNGFTLALPPDEDLFEELTSPRYFHCGRSYDKDASDPARCWLAQIRVESKDELAKADRLGRSPDRADAVAYALANMEMMKGFNPAWAIDNAGVTEDKIIDVWS